MKRQKYTQAFHDGEMNVICCLHYLNNVEEIMEEVKNVAHERLQLTKRNHQKGKSKSKLTYKVLDNFVNLFWVMDLSFSLLCTPAPTKEEINEARKTVFVLEQLWKKMDINITPKAHVMVEHAVDQFEMFGGIANKEVKEFIEKAHQVGKRLEYLTSCMPTNCC